MINMVHFLFRKISQQYCKKILNSIKYKGNCLLGEKVMNKKWVYCGIDENKVKEVKKRII